MIPFNRPYLTGQEQKYILQTHANMHLSGNGQFSQQCQTWLEERIGCPKALLTHSCTAAIELAAILADIKPGDEVILPSFTFVSTANAFALRGGTPVFVDIRRDTLNLDEAAVEEAITDQTRAIVPVHYAGVACEMQAISAIAERFGLLVIEDAAHGIMAKYHGRALGEFGHLACLSFHETKNIISGEGGALLINDTRFAERAEIVWEKGTNRSSFFRGDVDKYSWLDLGSSFLPSELIAAFLWAQMGQAEEITARRVRIWNRYHEAYAQIEDEGHVRRPIVSAGCEHNAHMYYLLMPDLARRNAFIEGLRARGVDAVSHYVPLHTSPAGRRFGRAYGDLPVTLEMSDRLVRLPLWIGVEDHLDYIIENVIAEVRCVAAHQRRGRSVMQ